MQKDQLDSVSCLVIFSILFSNLTFCLLQNTVTYSVVAWRFITHGHNQEYLLMEVQRSYVQHTALPSRSGYCMLTNGSS